MKHSTFTLIVMVIVAALSLVVYMFAVYYIGVVYNRSLEVSSALSDANATYLKSEGLRRVALSGGASLARINSFIIQPGDEVQTVKSIEQLALRAGLKSITNSIDIQDSPELAPYNKEYLHVSMTTTGLWSQTRLFLSLIEALPFNVKTQSVNLSLVDEKTKGGESPLQSRFEFSIVKEKDTASTTVFHNN